MCIIINHNDNGREREKREGEKRFIESAHTLVSSEGLNSLANAHPPSLSLSVSRGNHESYGNICENMEKSASATQQLKSRDYLVTIVSFRQGDETVAACVA
jgi:hypothetical protein